MKEGLVSPWTRVILEVKDSYAATTVLPPEQGSFPSDPDLGSGPNRARGLVFSPRWVWGPQLPPSPVPPARLYESQSPHTCPSESTWDTLRVPPCDTLSKIHWTALGPGEAG